jgi:hypothetical protein
MEADSTIFDLENPDLRCTQKCFSFSFSTSSLKFTFNMVTYKVLLVLAFLTDLLSLTDSTKGKTSTDI